MKSFVLFAVTFVIGAGLALGTRTILHDPFPAPAAPAASAHVEHEPTASAPSSDATPVNTLCAICGMEVDPSIKPVTYQGKLIGFGCAACPPRFARDPERYGPSALRNEIAPR